MLFLESFSWNSIFLIGFSDGLHVSHQMKASMYAKMKAKHTSIQNNMFLQARCTFSVRMALIFVKHMKVLAGLTV